MSGMDGWREPKDREGEVMGELREEVRIVTPGGELEGHLYVGGDGLPELQVTSGDYTQTGSYRPAQRPHTWKIRALAEGGWGGPLFDAYAAIDRHRTRLAAAQREAEQETPEPEDEITAAKRYKALEEETRGKE